MAPVRSINDVSYDEATTLKADREVVQGQPQAKQSEPDDGKVTVNESSFQADTQILDPNHELAVQVPEGSGADGAAEVRNMTQPFESGVPEDAFKSEAPKAEKPRRQSGEGEKS